MARNTSITRTLFMLLWVLLSFAPQAGQAAQNDTIPSALLYRITGNGLSRPSYILGSLHVVPREFVTRSQNFMEVARGVDRIVTEVDMRRLKAFNDSNLASAIALSKQVMPYIKLPADSQMQVIAPEKFRTVDSLFHSYRIIRFLTPNDTCWWHYDPGVIALSAQQMAIWMFKAYGFRRMGLEADILSPVIDNYMATLADTLHKDYTQLESFEYQMSLIPQLVTDFRKVKIDSAFINKLHQGIESMGNAAARANLLYMTSMELSKMSVNWKQMIDAYIAQDGQRTTEIMLRGSKQASTQKQAQQLELTARNERWMKTMIPMMKEKSNLFVVGLFHLTSVKNIGPGILETLQNAGYSITPVRM